MLTREENDLLCEVGPGTLMGELFRRFWLPATLPWELPEPDCAPVRLRLLSEDLVLWRNTDGSVGAMQNACPHRGASMFFGRNEENGLRCGVYQVVVRAFYRVNMGNRQRALAVAMGGPW